MATNNAGCHTPKNRRVWLVARNAEDSDLRALRRCCDRFPSRKTELIIRDLAGGAVAGRLGSPSGAASLAVRTAADVCTAADACVEKLRLRPLKKFREQPRHSKGGTHVPLPALLLCVARRGSAAVRINCECRAVLAIHIPA